MMTPRTDMMIQPLPGKDCVTGEPIAVVHADDCRKLERELAILKLDLGRSTARVIDLLSEQSTLESALQSAVARVEVERAKYRELQRYADAWRKSAEGVGQEIVKEREAHAATKAILTRAGNDLVAAITEHIEGSFTKPARTHRPCA